MKIINGQTIINESFKDITNNKMHEKVHFVHSYPNEEKVIEITGNKETGKYVMKITNKKKNIEKKYKINQKQYEQVVNRIKEKTNK